MMRFGRLLGLFSNTASKSSLRLVKRWKSSETPRILITGGLGQLGQELAKMLRENYGAENVLLSDVVQPTKEAFDSGPFIYADILDYKNLQSIVVNNRITWLIHFSALVSAIGELNVQEAIKINITGFHNIIELCRRYQLRLFCPSTIGAFGPDTPGLLTPDLTVQRPQTIYGVSKVHMELLGEYYNYKYGVDFRSARYPGVVSVEYPPGGGTTDYVIHVFHEALRTGKYKVYLQPNTCLPMIYITDCLRGTIELLKCPADRLTVRTYNMQGVSFTPEELFDEIRKYIPHLEIEYEIDPMRQAIADGWPDSLDDTNAQKDWGWKPDYDLAAIVKTAFDILTPQHT